MPRLEELAQWHAVFECPWCHGVHAPDEFSLFELADGPLCPVCGERLRRREAQGEEREDPRLVIGA